jgi:hypothetical protein
LDLDFNFCGQTMAMAAMGMVAAWWLLGVGYLKKKCPQGAWVYFSMKPLFFWIRLPKLDQLTVFIQEYFQNEFPGNASENKHWSGLSCLLSGRRSASNRFNNFQRWIACKRRNGEVNCLTKTFK